MTTQETTWVHSIQAGVEPGGGGKLGVEWRKSNTKNNRGKKSNVNAPARQTGAGKAEVLELFNLAQEGEGRSPKMHGDKTSGRKGNPSTGVLRPNFHQGKKP